MRRVPDGDGRCRSEGPHERAIVAAAEMGDRRAMTMRFRTCPAPPAVAGAVRELWMLDDDGDLHAGLPKPHVELVVSLAGVHWWRATPDGPEHRYVDGWVTPIQDGPRHARAEGRRSLIGARLQPWAAVALFGPLPPGDGTPPPLLRRFVGAGAGSLRAALIAADGDEARFTCLSAWLDSQPALRRATVGPDHETGTSVAALARSLRTTPRTLRRRFARDAGVSPKDWLKLRRFDAVLRDPALADPARPLADVAAAHGYADQAHLSREVGGFAGTTPRRLRRRPGDAPPHLLPGPPVDP